jgi:hypothetical protein
LPGACAEVNGGLRRVNGGSRHASAPTRAGDVLRADAAHAALPEGRRPAASRELIAAGEAVGAPAVIAPGAAVRAAPRIGQRSPFVERAARLVVGKRRGLPAVGADSRPPFTRPFTSGR